MEWKLFPKGPNQLEYWTGKQTVNCVLTNVIRLYTFYGTHFLRGEGALQSAVTPRPWGVWPDAFWFGWIRWGRWEAVTAYAVSGGRRRIMCLLRRLDFTFHTVVPPLRLDVCAVRRGRRWLRRCHCPCGGAGTLALPALPGDGRKGSSVTSCHLSQSRLHRKIGQRGKKNCEYKSQSIYLSKHRVRLTLVCGMGLFFGPNAGRTRAVAALMTFYAWERD